MKFGSSRRMIALVLASLMIGCGGGERNRDTPIESGGVAAGTGQSARPAGSPSASSADPGTATDEAPTELQTVLFVGTSLTAAQGLPVEQSFPLLIAERIEDAGLPYRVVNAGVSGETSAGALRRVDWLLQQDFAVLVLETGANDMLRGVDPASTEENIQEIIDRVRGRRPGARIVLAGMMALPNLGEDYGARFAAIYPRLAERNDLTLVPFLLEDVAAERDLNLADGLHPNPAGHRIIAETVWRTLEPVLREGAR